MFISSAYAQSAGPAPAGGEFMQIGFLIVLFALFYFLAIRPQRKRQKEHTDMISALKKGEKLCSYPALMPNLRARHLPVVNLCR